MTFPRRALAALAVTAVLGLSGCSSEGSEEELTPAEALGEAKTTLDETSGVRIELTAEELPAEVDGIVSAVGVGTHDPAFEGDLRVNAGGMTVPVPVVATEGKVFAQLPFTTKFVPIDPAEYAAPDPADLMGTEAGLSSLLTAAEGVETGDPVRDGEDVLTSYTGTVPGATVAGIIPSASADSDFEAQFTLDEDNTLREAVLTGPFYPDADDVTYTIGFTEYDTSAEITAP